MEIQISDVPHEGLRLSYELSPCPAGPEANPALKFCSPVEVLLDLLKAGKGVLYVEGRASAKARSGCSRCLEDFSLMLKADFQLECRPQPASLPEGECLLPREALDVLFYSGDQIDLDSEIVGQLILAAPMNPLCRPACRGLCPECGENLNLARCGCQQDQPAACWAGLKHFVQKESHAKSKT